MYRTLTLNGRTWKVSVTVSGQDDVLDASSSSASAQDFTDKKDYVATQVGNPEKGPDAPNKKYYDPR